MLVCALLAADAAREKFFVPESDHLTLLHVYQQWKNNGYRGDWCARHYLQQKGLKKAKEVRGCWVPFGICCAVCSCCLSWQTASCVFAAVVTWYVEAMPCSLLPTLSSHVEAWQL